MRRLLSIATLYPNPQLPRFGTFVARSLEALAAREDWEVTVINPIGLPPVTFGHYRALARAVVSGNENGVLVHRLRFPLIPRIGGRFNPALIARSVLPLAHRLHAAQLFDVVDAQFFYPDGPAAARIAAALDLPLSIKARGADISYWGARPYARAAMCDAADRADILLAVSEALRDDMAQLGLQREKIAIHYTGLDRALFHPRNRTEAPAEIASRFGIATGGPLLATVGALIPPSRQGSVPCWPRRLRRMRWLPRSRVSAGPKMQRIWRGITAPSRRVDQASPRAIFSCRSATLSDGTKLSGVTPIQIRIGAAI